MMKMIKFYLKPIKQYIKCVVGYARNRKKKFVDGAKCWYIGTPLHKNYGDHAIAYASIMYLQNILPSNYSIVEVSEDEAIDLLFILKREIANGDIIILHGGGNFGNQYVFAEEYRRLVIKHITNVPIIMFPQTVYFTNDRLGDLEKKRSIRIYSKNHNLLLSARDQTSANLMEEMFPNKSIISVPDIVMSLDLSYEYNRNYRDKILVCLRSDVEGVFGVEQKKQIMNILSELDDIEVVDTISERNISINERKSKLFALIDRFAKSRLIVTDRLHGMIFAYITNTPCILFSNYNHKIKGVYQWIKDSNRVLYVEKIEDMSVELASRFIEEYSQAIDSLPDQSAHSLDYSSLKELIVNAIHNDDE